VTAHDLNHDPSNATTPVDATLEQILDNVEDAVAAYLEASDSSQLDALVAALGQLDEYTARSDAYESSLVNAPIWGLSGKGSVLGETSGHPFVELVPNSVLDTQVELVKHAKSEVRTRTLTTLESLRAALAALDEARQVSA
jgi:hypothetical protein